MLRTLFSFTCRRDRLSWEDITNLASFLGEQLRHIHLLQYPPLNISAFAHIEQESDLSETNGCIASITHKSNIPAEWEIFIRTLTKKRKDVTSRLTKWYNLFFWVLTETLKIHKEFIYLTFLVAYCCLNTGLMMSTLYHCMFFSHYYQIFTRFLFTSACLNCAYSCMTL